MSGYVLGRDAEQDLNDTWDYIAEDSVDAADRRSKVAVPNHHFRTRAAGVACFR